jgi:hypothetical protein
MKTFREFILEAKNRYEIPDDEYSQWQADRTAGKGPARKTFNGVEYEMRSKARAGQSKTIWAVSPVSSRNKSGKKRIEAEKKTELSQDELRSAAGGDEERASLAKDTEETGIKKVIKRGKKIQKATGVRQSLGHKQPLQPDKPTPEDPGHTLSNVKPEPLGPNASKKNKRPEPEESGYGLTRTQAKQDALKRGDKLGKKIDREVDLLKSGKPSKAAELLGYLRRPKPKNTGVAQRMSAAYDKKVDDTMNS